MEEYYSRINGFGEKELLEDHLRKTSELCEQFTSKFGMPVTGRVIGRLHDIGKHTKKFQEVLFRNRTKVNHAIVGGKLLNDEFAGIWNDISYIVASHHHGLKRNWNYNPDYAVPHSLIDVDEKENSLDSELEFQHIKEWINDIGFNIKSDEKDEIVCEVQNIIKSLPSVNSKKKLSINEWMFVVRMVFSCLVDADYSASASFENPDYCDIFNGKKLNASELIKKLSIYRENLIENSKSNVELNELRNQVYNACVSKGKSDCGNYTLTAPTGTGKTLAMLAFALEHAKKHNKDRIIFVLPYLSIIEQNANIYKEICGKDIVLEDDSQTVFDERTKTLSERWSSPIIVTTSVKFFETLFKYKGTDLRKLHNICNSVIMFDESQTLPFGILDSSLEVLNVLNNVFDSTTVFSTATQPSFDYRKNINWHPNEIIVNPQDLYNRYRDVKKLNICWDIDERKSYKELYSMLKNRDSFLVIFNLKKQANQLFQIFQSELTDSEKDGLFYITTNLCSAHRINVLKEINQRRSVGLPTKVISTQCLEAGVDLDFQYVYRAFGPATSIIQASGRASRNALYPGTLTVFIPEDESYPGEVYEKSTQQLRRCLQEKGNFDINSLGDIDEYYKKCFLTKGLNADSLKLINAISECSYKNTSDNYRLINNPGVNIIVPYLKGIKLYDSIFNLLNLEGFYITRKLMHLAQPITVTSYDKNFAENNCCPLPFKFFEENKKSGWYIMSKGKRGYNEFIGLDIKSNEALFY